MSEIWCFQFMEYSKALLVAIVTERLRRAAVLFDAESYKQSYQELPPNSSKGQLFRLMQKASELQSQMCV